MRTLEDSMRRLITVGIVVLFSASFGGAQANMEEVRASDSITHGQFAQLVMNIALGYSDATPDPETALEKLQGWGIAPTTWEADTPLTHGELSQVLAQVGIEYLPANADAPVSGSFVATTLYKSTGKLRDYMAYRLGHGFSANHVLDAGVDRAVSPADYD
jgi:hypothetical protein